MYNVSFAILALCLFLVSCTNDKSYKNKVDIQDFSKDIFKGYEYKYEVGILKPNAEMSNILISKDIMSEDDFVSVQRRMLKKGWIKKDFYNGLYIYCYGVYNKLGILYSKKYEYFDRSGSRIIIGDFDEWLIYYVYNNEGVNGCN